MNATPANKIMLMERPAFHLVYLLFYFTPWFFAKPSGVDIGAAAIALIIFIPLYFRAFAQGAPIYLLSALAVEGIALAVGPFHGMEGTYHIYAASIAGFQADIRRGIGSIILLCVVYALFAHFITDAPLGRTGMILFMSGIVGATCIASSQSIIAHGARERSLMLDRQLAAVEERERIARDLHDILGHTLTMVAVKADLADKLLDHDPAKARLEISDIRQAARDALIDVRDTVQGMTVVTIAEEIERARNSLAAMDIEFNVSGTVPDLPTRSNKAVGLAIRESVTNIVRHSGATSVKLNLVQANGMFTFSIVDNGERTSADDDFELGAGLQGLTRRITALGGKALIDLSAGTRLEVSLPLTEIGAT